MRKTLLVAAAAGALGLVPGAAWATTVPLSPTGSAPVDPNWQVSCEIIEVGVVNANCNSLWQQAQRVTASPAGWTTVPYNGAYYISALSSGSVGNSSGENARYQYSFRTFFDLTGLNPGTATLSLDTFWFDNYWVGIMLNGSMVNPLHYTMTPTPAPPNGSNWTQVFQLSVNESSYFVNGVNELQLVISGNGQTDGILALGSVTASAVPEPISLLLLGTGLAGVAAARRRRRSMEITQA